MFERATCWLKGLSWVPSVLKSGARFQVEASNVKTNSGIFPTKVLDMTTAVLKSLSRNFALPPSWTPR